MRPFGKGIYARKDNKRRKIYKNLPALGREGARMDLFFYQLTIITIVSGFNANHVKTMW